MGDPIGEIAKLDRALAKGGMRVTLSRRIAKSAATVDVDLQAKIVPLRSVEEPLTNSANQQDQQIIHSQTEINAAGWPGAAGGPPYPVTNDWYLVGGSRFTVRPGLPMQWLDGTLVRIEAVIRGGGG